MIRKSVIFIFTFFVSVSSNEIEILNPSASNTPIAHTHMSQLLELCYADGMKPIAITPNLMDVIYKDSPGPITDAPIIVIDNDSISKQVQIYHSSYPLYVLSVDTTKQLESLLTKLRSSPFWNFKSTFFVFGNPEKLCKDAAAILKLLWRFHILSSFVMCSENNNQTIIYSYNPFTKRAPDPWTEVTTTKKPTTRWTLYMRFFVNDNRLCNNLDWDKTRFLDGYPAKIGKYVSSVKMLYHLIFPSLDMTSNVKYFQQSNITEPIFEPLEKGQLDISAQPYSYDANKIFVKYLDPIPVNFEINYVIVTQDRSFISSSSQLALQFDINTVLAIIILLFLITIMVTMNRRFQFELGFLDFINLAVNLPINLPFGWISVKIFFFIFTLFMFVFGPDLQGKLFSVLSRPKSYKIENLKDLHTHRYKIYFDSVLHYSFICEKLWTTDEDIKLLNPQVSFYPTNCLELAVEDNTVACVYKSDYIIRKALKKNLHVSQEFSFKINFMYWTRKDWEMQDRVYKRTLNILEAGIEESVEKSHIRILLKKKKAKDRMEDFQKYQEIDADDLEYIFWLVGFCQILGIVVFGVEHLIAWLLNRRNDN